MYTSIGKKNSNTDLRNRRNDKNFPDYSNYINLRSIKHKWTLSQFY